jgi:hypothetical protein
MVHRRELNGTVLVLGNQGALWGNAMTWWDHGTGSIWSQPIVELELTNEGLVDTVSIRSSEPDDLDRSPIRPSIGCPDSLRSRPTI